MQLEAPSFLPPNIRILIFSKFRVMRSGKPRTSQYLVGTWCRHRPQDCYSKLWSVPSKPSEEADGSELTVSSLSLLDILKMEGSYTPLTQRRRCTFAEWLVTAYNRQVKYLLRFGPIQLRLLPPTVVLFSIEWVHLASFGCVVESGRAGTDGIDVRVSHCCQAVTLLPSRRLIMFGMYWQLYQSSISELIGVIAWLLDWEVFLAPPVMKIRPSLVWIEKNLIGMLKSNRCWDLTLF